MRVARFICINIFLFTAHVTSAQSDTLERYYRVDFNQEIDKFEREHDQINGQSAKMIPYRNGRLFGFVKPGKPNSFLIEPQFSQVYGVYEHGAIVKDSSRGYGFINFDGDYVIPPYFSNLYKEGQVFHGSFFTAADSSYGLPENYNACFAHFYYDLHGELLFSELTHEYEWFSGGDSLTWFRFGRTYHIRSNTGRLAKTFQVDSNRQFVGISHNLLVFKSDYDSLGNNYYWAEDENSRQKFKLYITTSSLDGIFKLSDNFFGLQGHHGDYMFCDSTGTLTGYGTYSNSVGLVSGYASYFNQQQFVVEEKGSKLYGIVNRNGIPITEFKYSMIYPFVDNLCFAKIDSDIVNVNGHPTETNRKRKNVLLDRLGNERKYKGLYPDIEQYQMLMKPPGFYEGLIWSKDFLLMYKEDDGGKKKPYIDYDSMQFVCLNSKSRIQFSLPSSMVYVGVYSEGLAPAVNKDKKLGFLDKKGNWVISPKYELSMAGAYPFPYIVTPQFIGGYAYIKAFKGYIDKQGNEYFGGEHVQDHYDFSH